jgi:hypothetical protein
MTYIAGRRALAAPSELDGIDPWTEREEGTKDTHCNLESCAACRLPYLMGWPAVYNARPRRLCHQVHDHQEGSPRKIDVGMGYNGDLAIYQPKSIIVAKVA